MHKQYDHNFKLQQDLAFLSEKFMMEFVLVLQIDFTFDNLVIFKFLIYLQKEIFLRL